MYADLHYRFHEVLRECDRMIVSGYGWADTGITNQIDRWLDQRASNRVVLLHERPEEMVERSPIIGRSYEDLVQRRQLVLVRRWMCHTSLQEIRSPLSEN
jgi:hypothetical protein